MNLSDYDLPRSCWEKLIDEWIFSELDRRLLKRYLLDGIRFVDLADEVSMSDRQVRTRIKNAKEVLFSHV